MFARRFTLSSSITALALASFGASAHAQARPAGGGGIDRVPEEFATIQDAIDHGHAKTIRVAAGEYAGAVLDRGVALLCEGLCSITSGVSVGESEAGLVLEAGADGSAIFGFDFVDLDLGIYASCEFLGTAPDAITIRGNAFVNTAQGVTVNGVECDGGDRWIVELNHFHDLRSDLNGCGGGLGVFALGVDDLYVGRNDFAGEIAAPPCGPLFTTAAVYLSGTSDARIARNDFALGDGGHPFKLDVVLFADDGPNESADVVFNDASGSAAPFEGVHYLSVDSVDLNARCNTGTTAIEETGAPSARYTEIGCRRVRIP